MAKITFMGAGSTVFAKNVLGDVMLTPSLRDGHIALYDIDGERLSDSKTMLDILNENVNEGRATITAHLGVENRRTALAGADYVVNAIQVGGYEPSTVIDFEIPKKYGLRQTIADTLGVGGIFRGLRTIPVVLDFARDMEAVCPDAWFLNYTNPMCMVTGAVLAATPIRTVGLCHSVQVCARGLLWLAGMEVPDDFRWKIAGINHQGWLLEISAGGRDLYPEIKQRIAALLPAVRAKGGRKVLETARATHGKDWVKNPEARVAADMIRLTMMLEFGHYLTESSEHSAEYMPYWIKRSHPELIDEFNIPLDEYISRCIHQIARWKTRRDEIVGNRQLTHRRTEEYGSYIMEAMETDVPYRIGGNVANNGLITNLPRKACVEVACLVDRNGVQPAQVGDLPEQCAALNRTNINVQLLTIEAALTRRRDRVYQAAMLDPHAAAELTLDEIRNLCDELIDAHGDMLPTFR
jgi:alpha-galactosidase